jgi:hypothetical protein
MIAAHYDWPTVTSRINQSGWAKLEKGEVSPLQSTAASVRGDAVAVVR